MYERVLCSQGMACPAVWKKVTGGKKKMHGKLAMACMQWLHSLDTVSS